MKKKKKIFFFLLGHYILVVGYNPLIDVFIYKNPGVDTPKCFVPSYVLEKSKSSYGTEGNLIKISL